MKKILVPCDFSKPASNAFRFALDIAAKTKGDVHLLHAIELPVLNDTVLMPVLSFEADLMKELKEKAKIEFEKLITKYNKSGIIVTTKIQFGVPSLLIQEYASKNGVDIIVMGSHGTNGAREFFIGSNAEKIIRHAKMPVLVLKDYYKGPIKNIVFPNTLDTDNQEDLVMKVKALQNFFNAKLHIVWINTPLNFTSDGVTKERLQAFAKRFMFKDYTINIYNHFNAEEGILEFANSIQSHLIAMGTNGRKGIAHLISGSLTESVANHTTKLLWSYIIKKPTKAK